MLPIQPDAVPPSNPSLSRQPYCHGPITSSTPACMLPISGRQTTSILFTLTHPTTPPLHQLSSYDTVLPADSVLSSSPIHPPSRTPPITLLFALYLPISPHFLPYPAGALLLLIFSLPTSGSCWLFSAILRTSSTTYSFGRTSSTTYPVRRIFSTIYPSTGHPTICSWLLTVRLTHFHAF